MEYYLILQFGSYDLGTDVVKLCMFPNKGILPEKYKINLNWWNKGKTYRKSFQSVDKRDSFLSEFGGTTFNDLEIKLVFEPFYVTENIIKIVAIRNYLKLSPLNSLWGNVYGYILEERNHEKRRDYSEEREIRIRSSQLFRYPSLFVTIVTFESSLTRKELINHWTELIRNNIPSAMTDIGIFGCGDIYGQLPMRDMLEELAGYPLTYDKLDNNFDKYHDILITNKELCKSIAMEAGETNNYKDIFANNKETKYGLVNLHPYVETKFPNYFVIKDESTKLLRPGQDQGEFKTNTRTLITRRRFKELVDKKILETTRLVKNTQYPWLSWEYYPLVNDDYLEMLGINTDDVLMDSNYGGFSIELIKKIDKNFAELADVKDIRKRIWMAHEKAYLDTEGFPQDVIDLVKQMFFSHLD